MNHTTLLTTENQANNRKKQDTTRKIALGFPEKASLHAWFIMSFLSKEDITNRKGKRMRRRTQSKRLMGSPRLLL